MYLEGELMKRNLQTVDVICQHSRDGSVIPMRVRVFDSDGDLQTYTIKGYRLIKDHGTRTMPDGVYVDGNTLVYECNIINFGVKKMIRLYYQPTGTVWKMSV